MSLDELLNPSTPPRRFVITGGPSAGKEAVIAEIQKQDIPCTEGEPAREIYRQHRERLGRHLQVGDRRAYSRDVLEAFVAEFCAHTFGLRFYNRGIPDGYGWDRFFGLEPYPELAEATGRYRLRGCWRSRSASATSLTKYTATEAQPKAAAAARA